MAAAQEKSDPVEKTENLSIIERLNDFLQKNRRSLFWGFIAVILVLAGSIIFITVRDKLRADAFSKLDLLNLRYDDLKDFIGSEDPEAASKQPEITSLLEDLKTFAENNSGFAAARSYSISAGIYEAEKKWPEAEKAWTASAAAAPDSYLAPVSLFCAAVAAEEHGNTQSAIDLYNRALNYENAFSIAARAQFSIGRLEEARNNREAALEAYRNLVSKWPNDMLWTNLAQSRIIVLLE